MNNKYDAKNRYFGSVANNYVNDRKSAKWDKEQKLFKNTFQKLGKELKVIDIPAGTGRFFEFYSLLNYDVTAVDISSDMLEVAKRKAPKDLKVIYKVADAESLMPSEKKIDCVICARFLNWLPEDVFYKVLNNFKRLTSEHLLIQVRLKKRALFSELLNDFKNQLQLKKIKRLLIKILLKNKVYNDYFVHSYFDTINYLQESFDLISIQQIDTRYQYLKLEKHTFLLIHCKRK